MKKPLVAMAAFLTLNASAAFAAPINDLSPSQTALGIGSDTFYVEHKLSDKFTLGYQNVDWDNAGSFNDIYGEMNFNSNLRGIIGSRNFDAASKMYLGLAVDGPISSDAGGYASLVAGDQFKEFQVGTNITLAHNAALNLNYHSYMPDAGSNKTGVGVGATFKF